MTEFSFTERAPHEAGFAEVFHRDIVPYLRTMEVQRSAEVAGYMRWFRIAAAATAILAVLAAAYVHPAAMVFPLFVGGVAMLMIYISRGGRTGSEVAADLRPALCGFLTDMESVTPVPQGFLDLDAFRALHVLPRTDETRTDTGVRGSWRGIDYRLARVHCYEWERDHDGDRKRRSYFSGIALEIDCPVDMPRTVFLPDLGATGNSLLKWASRSSLPDQRWHLGDPKLEEIFEVYTDDVALAERHMAPRFGHVLVELAERFQNQRPYCAAAFRGRRFFLALRLPHGFLSFDGIGTASLCDIEEPLHRALADLVIPRQVIDTLLD